MEINGMMLPWGHKYFDRVVLVVRASRLPSLAQVGCLLSLAMEERLLHFEQAGRLHYNFGRRDACTTISGHDFCDAFGAYSPNEKTLATGDRRILATGKWGCVACSVYLTYRLCPIVWPPKAEFGIGKGMSNGDSDAVRSTKKPLEFSTVVHRRTCRVTST